MLSTYARFVQRKLTLHTALSRLRGRAALSHWHSKLNASADEGLDDRHKSEV